MPSVELIYFPGCPNVEEARSRLVKAFAGAKLNQRWSEFRTDDPDLPGHARGYGSPTIFVNGNRVMGTFVMETLQEAIDAAIAGKNKS